MKIEFEAPLAGKTLDLILFKDVSNIEEIIAALKAGTAKPEAAILDATHIASIEVVQLAAYHAAAAAARGALKSRTIHSEIVFNVSASKHIAESYRRFGPAAASKHLLVARLDASAEDLADIRKMIQGTEVTVSDTELASLSDMDSLAKTYKVAAEELEVGTLAEAILCRIAARDC